MKSYISNSVEECDVKHLQLDQIYDLTLRKTVQKFGEKDVTEFWPRRNSITQLIKRRKAEFRSSLQELNSKNILSYFIPFPAW